MEKEVAIEFIKIIPSLLWTAIALGIVFLFRNSIKTDLLPRITNFKALGVEATFVKNELDRVASESKEKIFGSSENRNQVARRSERVKEIVKGSKVLLVNDVPSQMSYVVNILEKLNVKVTIARSTEEAIDNLERYSFDVVISDMKRGDEIDAGINMLRRAKELNINKPTLFTVGQYDPGRGVPAYAFGITNRIDELINLIFDVIERTKG
jgi:CheY-like chemotaxis protein